MSMKKTILPHEWEQIEEAAKDPNGSTSRIFDILRAKRVEAGVELMNRSWFLSFLRNVCGCTDGKLKYFRRPQEKKVEQQVQETAVVEKPEKIEQNVQETAVTKNESESISELLSDDTLFVLRWLYQHKTEAFHAMIAAGYSKSKVSKASDELVELGVIKKKNAKRFFPFDWDQILRDFPEVKDPYSEQKDSEMKTVKRAKRQEKETVVETHVEEPKKKAKSNLDKALDWLLEEEHPCGEITKGELISEIRRYKGVSDPYLEAEKVLEYWIQQRALEKVRGTEAFRILQSAKLLKIVPMQPEEVKTVEKMPSVQIPQQTIPSHRIIGSQKDIVLESSKVRIKNESNSRIELIVREKEVVVRILD